MGKLPEILFLMREKIEKEADIKPTTPDEFAELVEYINNKLKVMPVAKNRSGFSLSEKTIRRLWKKEKYDSTPRLATLTMLSKVARYKRWEDFEKETAKEIANINYLDSNELLFSTIKPGERAVLGDYPDCYIYLECYKKNKFKVLFYVGTCWEISSDGWYVISYSI